MDGRATLAKTNRVVCRALRSPRQNSVIASAARRSIVEMRRMPLNPNMIPLDVFVGRKLSHRSLKADLAFFEHIGAV